MSKRKVMLLAFAGLCAGMTPAAYATGSGKTITIANKTFTRKTNVTDNFDQNLREHQFCKANGQIYVKIDNKVENVPCKNTKVNVMKKALQTAVTKAAKQQPSGWGHAAPAKAFVASSLIQDPKRVPLGKKTDTPTTRAAATTASLTVTPAATVKTPVLTDETSEVTAAESKTTEPTSFGKLIAQPSVFMMYGGVLGGGTTIALLFLKAYNEELSKALAQGCNNPRATARVKAWMRLRGTILGVGSASVAVAALGGLAKWKSESIKNSEKWIKHLNFLNKPFAGLILNGEKTTEEASV